MEKEKKGIFTIITSTINKFLPSNPIREGEREGQKKEEKKKNHFLASRSAHLHYRVNNRQRNKDNGQGGNGSSGGQHGNYNSGNHVIHEEQSHHSLYSQSANESVIPMNNHENTDCMVCPQNEQYCHGAHGHKNFYQSAENELIGFLSKNNFSTPR